MDIHVYLQIPTGRIFNVNKTWEKQFLNLCLKLNTDIFLCEFVET